MDPLFAVAPVIMSMLIGIVVLALAPLVLLFNWMEERNKFLEHLKTLGQIERWNQLKAAHLRIKETSYELGEDRRKYLQGLCRNSQKQSDYEVGRENLLKLICNYEQEYDLLYIKLSPFMQKQCERFLRRRCNDLIPEKIAA